MASVKRRRFSTKTAAAAPRAEMHLQPGDSLLLLIRANKNGGIVHQLQPRLVPEIIARCGMRWWNAEATPQVASVMRQLIIDHNIGGFGPSYDKLRQANLASELKVVQHLRAAQAHTATNHMNSASRLIAKLFRQTPALKLM